MSTKKKEVEKKENRVEESQQGVIADDQTKKELILINFILRFIDTEIDFFNKIKKLSFSKRTKQTIDKVINRCNEMKDDISLNRI